VCGDGIVVGAETCDDGNTADGDGCNATCDVETGYTCSGSPSTCGTICGDGLILGAETCDDGNPAAGDGCDGACHIEAGHSCTGMPSVCTPGCGDGAVAGSEACDDGNTRDGDGCSHTCQIEAGFTCHGVRSFCCIPEREPNDDPASATGRLPADAFACGSLDDFMGDSDYFSFTMPAAGDLIVETYNGSGDNAACGSVFTVLDLYGPDGQTLIAHNESNGLINPEIPSRLSYCSTISPTFYPSVHGLPPGTYYAKVTAQSTTDAYSIKFHPIICGDGVVEWGEQCDGGPGCDASCVATAPGPGESMSTAAPFPGCPTTPSSTMRLQVPSCFPQSGPIQWYSHVATDQALAVTSNASGPIALFDASGNELRCSLDASRIPVATFSGAGNTFYVAVAQPSAMTCLDFDDHPYNGLQGTLTDLNVTFPARAWSGPRTDVAVGPTQIFVGTSSKLYEAPKTGNAVAIPRQNTNIISYLGVGLYFLNGSMFGVLKISGFGTNQAARLARIFDGSTFSRTIWETSVMYPDPNNRMNGFTYDGASFIAVRQGVANAVEVYSYSASSPAPHQLIANLSPWGVMDAAGIAADHKYLYIAGNGPLGNTGAGPRREGVYRFDRADLLAPPIQIASYDTIINSPNPLGLALDDLDRPTFLYGRDTLGNIHVISDPAGAAQHLGIISSRGIDNDLGLAYDAGDKALYFVELESDPNGRIIKLQ
jgi:cysteine-rich repeat protein